MVTVDFSDDPSYRLAAPADYVTIEQIENAADKRIR
jgi:hypothetical protein